MSRTNGYILLYKQITDKDSWLWSDKPFSRGQAWIDLLLMANYQDQKVAIKGQIIDIKRGQLLRGTNNLADRWGWSRSKVIRFLEQCEADGMCFVNGTAYGTIISIRNYDAYQDPTGRTPILQKNTKNDTANRTPSDTPITIENNSTNEEVRTPNDTAGDTSDDTTGDTRINNINKYKEEGAFVPPSAADVISFFEANNYESDPKQFYHWYDLNKWTKKNGQPIDDWQQMAHSWEQREKGYIEERKNKNGRSNVPVQPEPPHYPEFEPEPERKAEPPTEEQRKRMRETLS